MYSRTLTYITQYLRFSTWLVAHASLMYHALALERKKKKNVHNICTLTLLVRTTIDYDDHILILQYL